MSLTYRIEYTRADSEDEYGISGPGHCLHVNKVGEDDSPLCISTIFIFQAGARIFCQRALSGFGLVTPSDSI